MATHSSSLFFFFFSLWYSCLGNPMDRGARQATVHGVARVGHDLATTPPPPSYKTANIQSFLIQKTTTSYSQPNQAPA